MTKYPQSRWADDGRVKIIELSTDLIGQGQTKYKTFLTDNLENVNREIRLRAVIALAEIREQETLPVLLQTLEQENIRLKRLVAEKELDIQILKEALSFESKNF